MYNQKGNIFPQQNCPPIDYESCEISERTPRTDARPVRLANSDFLSRHARSLGNNLTRSVPVQLAKQDFPGAVQSARYLRQLRRGERVNSEDTLSNQERNQDFSVSRTVHKAARILTMDRQPYQGEQYEIIQQGPELQDSPRSDRGDTSPRVARTSFFNLATESGAHNSAGSSRSHSTNNSPSLSKRAPMAASEAEPDDHQSSPRRSSQPRLAPQQPQSSYSPHPNDPRSRYYQQPYPPYVAPPPPIYRPVTPDSNANAASQGQIHGLGPEAYYYPTSSVPQQPPYIYHQTAVYPGPPHYYYAAGPHGHAPGHPYLATGPWVYGPPPGALFSPPAVSSSPAHHPFAHFAPHHVPPHQRSLQDSGTCTDDQLLYGQEESVQVKFRHQSPTQSPTHTRGHDEYVPEEEYGDREYRRTDSFESKTTEAETSPRHSSASSTNRYHTGAKLEKEHGRTPLFGERPSWWGQDDEEEEERFQDEHSIITSVRSEIEHPRLSAVRTSGRKYECASDTEASTPFKRSSAYQSSPSAGDPQSEASASRQRSSIRMEVSLSDVKTPEDEQPERDTDSRPRRAEGATAFTIEFAKEDESATRIAALDKAQAAERNWKAQSAERMHRNFVRRSLRKGEGAIANVPQKPPQLKTSSVTDKPKTAPPPSSSGKTYLLEKMLSSAASNSPRAVPIPEDPSKSPVIESIVVLQIEDSPATTPSSTCEKVNRRESDACSDAGTYVVDRDEDELMEARLKIDQVFGVCQDIEEEWQDEQEAETEKDNLRTPSPSSPPVQMEPVITPRFRNRSSSRGRDKPETATGTELEQDKKRKGLLKQLMKTSTAATSQPSPSKSATSRVKPQTVTTSAPKPPSTAPPARETAAFQARRQAAFNKRASFGTGQPSTAGPPGSVVSRSEAGRYSMRSSSVSGPNRSGNTTSVASKALPKTASPTTMPKNPMAVKDTENMKNWLRRKEYNPMKAAADAKKKAAVQQRAADEGSRKTGEEPVYLSNRSQSFHLGTVMAEASSAGLRKHPSLHDTSAQDFEDDQYDDDYEHMNVVSDSAAIYHRDAPELDQDSLERLASLSQELGQRAKNVLTRVSKRAGRSSDALHEMETSRNLEKEAALAALLNQLRVASQALQEVDRILPEEQMVERTTRVQQPRATAAKLKPARPWENMDV